jgi:hypothetical protein
MVVVFHLFEVRGADAPMSSQQEHKQLLTAQSDSAIMMDNGVEWKYLFMYFPCKPILPIPFCCS